jgi:excisionase family DNA binding protein
MNPAIQQTADRAEAPEVALSIDTLLTAEDVATMLQVTCAWVYAETRRQRIPHLRLGRYVRYRRSALAEWMQEVERSSARHRPSHRR